MSHIDLCRVPECSLLFLPSAPNTVIDYLNERLSDILDFTESDEPWYVSCRSYRDQVDARLRAAANSEQAIASYTPKVQYILTMGHVEPSLYSMIATTGGRQQSLAGRGESGIVVELDKQFELILAKLKNLWTKRHDLSIEGVKYERGDYVIRVGQMRTGSHISRGIWVQAEDLGQDVNAAEAFQNLRVLLRRVLEGIPGVRDLELSTGLHEPVPPTNDPMMIDEAGPARALSASGRPTVTIK
ncbi:hypothetical protein PhCBS80983_g02514 [Powellomyces hirtus]|uniref:Mediator of RNA polymerase II transcription subunit 20 n=1 Tax=Powellomyces hirtus TaxID=109895 RepID=A0A507E625_9FUNG|nr:hypothetical protein PhCBS80983_g02514 [Powellomyces hirtus]